MHNRYSKATGSVARAFKDDFAGYYRHIDLRRMNVERSSVEQVPVDNHQVSRFSNR